MSSVSRGTASNRANQVARRLEYRPDGDAFKDEYEAADEIPGWVALWRYAPPWSTHGCTVLRYDKEDGSKDFRVVSFHKGAWYISLPEPPYLLFNSHNLHRSKTVYVCEGEYAADTANDIGLLATTSLCGPENAAMSDWSPMKGKHVVILRDFDEDGMRYAQDVAQLALAAGALSAKIVTLPGLNKSEDLVEWVHGRNGTEECAIMQAEIEAMALAAPRVERQLPDGTRTELCRMSDVESESQDWVLDGVIPCGALMLITGEAGVGKSLFTLGVAAAVTRGSELGGNWKRSDDVQSGGRGVPSSEAPEIPTGGFLETSSALDTQQYVDSEMQWLSAAGTVLREAAAVVLFAASDRLARTIRPRLEAAGADLSLVYAVRGTESQTRMNGGPEKSAFQLDHDLETLETKLQQLKDDGIQVRLIIIDPISRFLGLGKTRYDADEMASRLTELANRSGAAIVLVADNGAPADTKGGGRQSRSSVDQNAIAAEARSIWKIVQDPDSLNRRHLLPIKSNLCESPSKRTFSIRDGVIEWEPSETNSINGLTGLPERRSELFRAITWLNEQLAEGRVCTIEINESARESAISTSTLRRAFHWLGALATKQEGAKIWYWYLPDHDPRTNSILQPTAILPRVKLEASFSHDSICVLNLAASVREGDAEAVDVCDQPNSSLPSLPSCSNLK